MKQNTNRYKEIAKNSKKQFVVNQHIHFVVISYVILMIYICVLIYLSFSKKEINYVYAEPGQIYEEGTFEGILIRNESIVYSDSQGPIRYYVPEGSKVRQNAYVCSVNQDPVLDRLISEKISNYLSQISSAVEMTSEDYALLQNKIKEYVTKGANARLSK